MRALLETREGFMKIINIKDPIHRIYIPKCIKNLPTPHVIAAPVPEPVIEQMEFKYEKQLTADFVYYREVDYG